MAAVDISMPDLMKRLTLDIVVSGQREASIRLWIGARLLRLAARVMGCGIEVQAKASDATTVQAEAARGWISANDVRGRAAC